MGGDWPGKWRWRWALGLTFGFVCRMIFFAMEIAGSLISAEMGISMPPGINPLADAPLTVPATMLYYLAAMLWLSLDMHHWMLIGFQKTYVCLPIGAAHLSQAAVTDIVKRTTGFLRRRCNWPRPAGRVVYYFAGFRRAGARGAADERFCGEFRRAAAGGVGGVWHDAGPDVGAHQQLFAPAAGRHAAGGAVAALTPEPHERVRWREDRETDTKRLEDAVQEGPDRPQPEVQTVFVLGGAMLALAFSGTETWRIMAQSLASSLGHLHDTPISMNAMQGYTVTAALVLGKCVGPVLVATVIGGLLAGGIQTRFRTTSDALGVHWERLSPVEGFKRLFSLNSTVSTTLGALKLSVVMLLCYHVIRQILADPIFYTSVDVARIAAFMAESSFKIVMQVGFALVVLAAADYGYKFWKNNEELKMTREELKDETKNTEGNPMIRAQQRRRRMSISKRKMLAEVPKADVVVTNPTHIAIALRYDRNTMKAPKIVAKGIRLNALQIKKIAEEHQVPIVENKPLARLMFKYGRVGGEIPAQLYAAVAEILAWVYRVNAYRYYREQSLAQG